MRGDHLRVIAGPALGGELELREGELVIGREPTSGNPLSQDLEISRTHARIIRKGEAVVIEDLGSSNGTFVNGERLSTRQVLRNGDEVRVGRSVLTLEGALQPTAVRRGPPPDATRRAVRPAAPKKRDNGIEVRGLVREFGGRRAVDGINLTVEPGSIQGFLGPNGAGKSTTVHMLTTLLPPTGGTATIAGYDLVTQSARVRSSIGVALQEAALDPIMNAWEHMQLQTALQGVPRQEREGRAQALIERVGLTHAADRRVGTYSGGMKRRLDLALSLVHGPSVLFLDEPTTGLDPKSRTDLWDEVRRLATDEGVTVFLTTQYLEEADLLADRVAIIDNGEIVAEGTPAELKAEIGRPTVDAVPVDEADRGAIAAVLARCGERSPAAHKGVAVRLAKGASELVDIVRALDAEGLRVAELNLHAPTLDDVFLIKTGRSLEERPDQAAAQEDDDATSEADAPERPSGRSRSKRARARR
jgi:ABC-2 type transport system ATP-binding protein